MMYILRFSSKCFFFNLLGRNAKQWTCRQLLNESEFGVLMIMMMMEFRDSPNVNGNERKHIYTYHTRT